MLNPGSFVTVICLFILTKEIVRVRTYVMFQITQLPVLLLLIKNVLEKAFIREGRGNISMNAMCSNKIFGVTEEPKKG